ncbi:MAG: response regulator, partial [Planctomycetota bacterium]
EARPQPPLECFKGMRAIIVGHNSTIRGILESQSRTFGLDVTSLGDAAAALEELRQAAFQNRPYRIGLLDMGLRGMDGLQLARAIRAESGLPSIHLVLLGSMSQRSQVAYASSTEFQGCLIKPIRESKLLECLRASVPTASASAPESAAAIPLSVIRSLVSAGVKSRPRILLVEDNIVNQRVALKMLERVGAVVDIACNGLEAIAAFEANTYEAVLMDCQMPELDGYAATNAIRRREKAVGVRVPIIALTANALEGDRERCIAAGMDDFLSKPFKAEDLTLMIQRWVYGDALPNPECPAQSTG